MRTSCFRLVARAVIVPVFVVILGSVAADDASAMDKHTWSDREKAVLRSLWLGSIPPLPVDPSNKFSDNHQAARFGRKLFFEDKFSGNMKVSCATCHRENDRRIRLQALPNLTMAQGAGEAYGSWPAYRISQGLVRTMGWRMRDCARQQRLPLLKMGSEASIALQTYLAVNATGAAMNAPGLKR